MNYTVNNPEKTHNNQWDLQTIIDCEPTIYIRIFLQKVTQNAWIDGSYGIFVQLGLI